MPSKERYGPWALLVGGSEGIGEHLARQLGAAGINIILVARKPEPLAETSRIVREETGVEVRPLQLDITRDDMLERIREVRMTEDLLTRSARVELSVVIGLDVDGLGILEIVRIGEFAGGP